MTIDGIQEVLWTGMDFRLAISHAALYFSVWFEFRLPLCLQDMPRPSSSFIPRYQKLASELIASIKSGIYAHGDVFPSEREISIKQNVSRHTVRVALGILADEGWVISHPGKGNYVQFPPRLRTEGGGAPESKQIGLIARASVLGNELGAANPLLGIKSALSVEGYSVAVSVASKEEKRRLHPIYPQWLKSNAMAGYLLASVPPRLQEYFAQHPEIPTLNLGYLWTDADIPSVRVDYGTIYERAIAHLIERGLVPFYHLSSRNSSVEDQRFAREVLQGYERGIGAHGLGGGQSLLVQYSDSAYDLISAVRSALSRNPRPRALVLGSGQHLLPLLTFLENYGFSIPGDLYILVLQTGTLPRTAYGKVAYFEYDVFPIAQRAGEKLLELISTGNTQPRHEVFSDGHFYEPHLLTVKG